jgi:hypothetical protein
MMNPDSTMNAVSPYWIAPTEEVLVSLDEASSLSLQLQALSKTLKLRDRELMVLCGVSRPTLGEMAKGGGRRSSSTSGEGCATCQKN